MDKQMTPPELAAVVGSVRRGIKLANKVGDESLTIGIDIAEELLSAAEECEALRLAVTNLLAFDCPGECPDHREWWKQAKDDAEQALAGKG